MEKLLTPDAARKVFGNGEAREFMKKGGVNYISTGENIGFDSNLPAIAVLPIHHGAFHTSGEMTMDPLAHEKMHMVNKELLQGNRISSGEMPSIESSTAARMLENAEKEIYMKQITKDFATTKLRNSY